ncbi:MAG: CNNM domain-containing protein, partial [bacterium]
MIVSFAILILGLLGAAFFAGTETAFIKLLGSGEDRRDFPADIRMWLKRPQTIFSVSLVGTNICHILASSIATKISITLFPSRGELYSLLIMTVTILVFSEVIPKSRALAGPESFARFASK